MLNKKYITQSRKPFFDLAAKYIKPNDRVLDIGSGHAAFAKHLGRPDIYNFDGNPETIEDISKEYTNSIHGNLPKLPFENDFFDHIHASHIVEHLEPEKLYRVLTEVDRVLKTGGYFTISAPLGWDKFYDDLSHVKPYNPYVFIKYLCHSNLNNTTRSGVSESFGVVELQYRYYKVPENRTIIIHPIRFMEKLARGFKWFLLKLGYRKIQVNGFTLILRKE